MDVIVIGGGIVGVAAAAFLAEGGAEVALGEHNRLGAGASGRNSGVVQHPFDPVLAPLYEETVEIYRHLEAPGTDAFPIDGPPDGLLSVGHDPEPLERFADDVRREFPELDPQPLAPAELERLEPALAAGLHGCRTETAWAVPPAAAVEALGARARAAGARIVGWPELFELDAHVTLVTAGPWTPSVVDPGGRWSPIERVWGVVADVELEMRPRHVLEEVGIPELAEALGAGEAAPHLFSLVSSGDHNALGSSFTSDEPNERALSAVLVERGRKFLSGIGGIRQTRACARPVSADGRPLIGPLRDGLHVCAGHGPWGISTGPASARLAADVILGRDVQIPPEMAAARFGVPATRP
jgi:glycine/D-amino acid oxidase-like deaminating enzyme